MAAITGDRRLDRKLKKLGTKTSKRLVSAGIRSGLTTIARAIRKEFPSSAKSEKKAIGSRFRKDKGGASKGIKRAVVGGGVGKKQKVSRRKSRGVGISKANIHWVLMGTGPRWQKGSGRFTGVMPKVNAVKRGYAKVKGSVLVSMKKNIRRGIVREAAKR